MLLSGKPIGGLRRAVGCSRCRGSGYRGRLVVAEILTVNAEFQHAIARGTDTAALTDIARRNGMESLWESGIERVLAGVTTLHELLDNVTAPLVEDAGEQDDVDSLLAKLLPRSGSGSGSADAQPVAAAALPPVVTRSSSSSGLHARVHSLGGSGARVLVIDDDREARRSLRAQLEQEGFHVLEAADGESGLAYARRLRPDLVITELVMPRLDGIGVLQALRDGPDASPVAVCTSQTDAAMLEWARELGAGAVASKPGDVKILTAVLGTARRNAA